jgi:hypothetical protein
MNTAVLSQEKEVWDILPHQEYERVMAYCLATIGSPAQERRLALQVTDFHRKDFDTRIRITNGSPVLIQKGGDWNDEIRGESTLELPKDAHFIVSLYAALRNKLNSDNIQRTVIQLENTLFRTAEVEIKLTRHIGKKDLFSFEVELLDDKGNLEESLNELGLTPDLSYRDDVYWKDFNAAVNIDAHTLSEEELVAMVSSFLLNG